MNIRLDESWRTALAPEFDKLYFSILTDRIRQAYQHEGPIYPPGGLIFRALDACPLPAVRVVILGQDPYHGVNDTLGVEAIEVAVSGIAYGAPYEGGETHSLADIFDEGLVSPRDDSCREGELAEEERGVSGEGDAADDRVKGLTG